MSFFWRVTTPGGCYPGQLLGNPGFETGTAGPWTATGLTGLTGLTNGESRREP